MSESDLHIEDVCRMGGSGARDVLPDAHSSLGLACKFSSPRVRKHQRESKQQKQLRSNSNHTWKGKSSSCKESHVAAHILGSKITCLDNRFCG